MFLPIVNVKLNGYAEVSIEMLRPERPGNLISETADIDNRLKTLFDALQVPKIEQLPANEVPAAEHSPFFLCLLEDDRLVTKVSVQAYRLLDPQRQDKNEVDLQIRIRFVFHLPAFLIAELNLRLYRSSLFTSSSRRRLDAPVN